MRIKFQPIPEISHQVFPHSQESDLKREGLSTSSILVSYSLIVDAYEVIGTNGIYSYSQAGFTGTEYCGHRCAVSSSDIVSCWMGTHYPWIHPISGADWCRGRDSWSAAGGLVILRFRKRSLDWLEFSCMYVQTVISGRWLVLCIALPNHWQTQMISQKLSQQSCTARRGKITMEECSNPIFG